MLHREIQSYFAQINDSPSACIEEDKIARKISAILSKDKKYKRTDEDIAEEIAFSFCQSLVNDEYYGPQIIISNEKGKRMEYPSREAVNDRMVHYWETRSQESKNLIMLSRYADLVIDFFSKVRGKQADVIFFQRVIDSNIKICTELLTEPINCIEKIKRALDLALKINDKGKVSDIVDTMINLEKNIAEDESSSSWGFSIDTLILFHPRKKILTKEKENELITMMEDRLERVKKNYDLSTLAADRLIEYYSNKNDEDNLMHIFCALEKSLKEDIRSSNVLWMSPWLQEIHEKYQRCATKGFQRAKVAAKKVLSKIGELNLKKSLKRIPGQIKIPKEQIDSRLDLIFGKNRKNELKKVLERIMLEFLPDRNKIYNEFKEYIKNNPLEFIVSNSIISNDGINTATMPPNDVCLRFKDYYSKDLQTSCFILEFPINELKELFSKTDIIEYFKNSFLFEEESEHLKDTLCFYWDGHYRVFSHLSIPLIERSIRRLIQKGGSSTLKPNKQGGYTEIGLGSLLREKNEKSETLNKAFKNICPDISFYFRLVLTEQVGMNLRNDIAHGINMDRFSSRGVSDRLFHIMICLLKWTP